MSRPKKKSLRTQISSESNKSQDFWIALVIALVTIAAFYPALSNQFVNWDDYDLLVDNINYRGLSWAQLRWMFSTFHTGHYQPLSWLTLALDYLVWGLDPFGYHLTNVILHAANAILFYFLALRLLCLALSVRPESRDLGIRAAAGFAALLFAIHPLRVESVAWATERRDVLCGAFFLLTLLCYVQANVNGRSSLERRRWLSAALISYVLSLLSKASGVGLPIVLLVLDIYPLKRLSGKPSNWFDPGAKPIWLEKVFFLLPAVAAAVVAPIAQYEAGATASLQQHSVVERLTQALFGLAFYLWKTVWPINLSPLYELPARVNPFDWPFLLSGAVVVAISIFVFVMRNQWPAGLASWVYYMVLLAPVLGLVQSGRQLVADRYSYLACLPWSILAGAGLLFLCQRSVDHPGGDRRTGLLVKAAALSVVFGLGVMTHWQAEVWRDTDTLWKQVLAITDKSIFRSGFAHHLMGRFLADRGELGQAIEHLRLSIEINPESTTYSDLGSALAKQGRLEEAIENFQQALARNPALSKAHFNLGNALALQGRLADAAAQFEEAVKIEPGYAQAYLNLGKLFAAQGQLDKAIKLFRHALEVNPDLAEAHQSLAVALADIGQREEAAEHYQRAMIILRARQEPNR
jgi:Flp pilus assembly protein TadD